MKKKITKVEKVRGQRSVFPFLIRLPRLCGKKFFGFLMISRYLKVNAGTLICLPASSNSVYV
jgi:hypothetical protein